MTSFEGFFSGRDPPAWRPMRLGPGIALSAWTAWAAMGPASAFALDPRKAPSQYAVDVYTERDGLPENSARAVLFSKKGEVWIGTDEGLARFDGARFKIFDRRSSPRMTSNVVFSLAEANDGTIWVGTLDGGLLTLSKGQIEPAQLPGPLPGVQIRALLDDGVGTLWIGTEGGVARIRQGQLRVFRREDGLPSNEVTGLSRSPTGQIWISTSNGAVRIESDRVLAGPRELQGLAIRGVAEAHESIWAATATRGLVEIRAGRARFLGSKEGFPGDDVHTVFIDRDGNVWGGFEAGLVRVRNDRAELVRRLPGKGAERIWLIAEDKGGALWVGAEIGGLARYRDADFVPFGAKEGLLADFAVVVASDAMGGIYVGTAAGLDVLEGGVTGSAHHVFDDHGPVLALYVNRPGVAWVATARGEVGLLRDGTMRWLSSRCVAPVRALFEDTGGVLWIGTGSGLARLDGDSIQSVPATDGLPMGQVHLIAQEPEGGALWVSIETKGLFRRMPGGRFELVPGGPPPQNDGNDALVDADGTLWIGTLGAGLWRWRGGHFTAFGIPQGLPDEVIWRTLDDGLGNLWFSSNKGVHRLSRHELEEVAAGRLRTVTAVSYGSADGMRSRDCTGAVQPAGARAPDGTLWFPTTEGVAVVNPAHLAPVGAPTVVIEHAVVDGIESVEPHLLDLAPGTNRFEIGYTAFAFSAPGEVRFRYRLDGQDATWVEAGDARSASFMHVPPGDYRFTLQARIAHSPWSDSITLPVHLRPWFWQTTWFYALALIGIVGSAAGFHLLRVRRLRVQETVLRTRIEEAVAQVKVLSGLLPICAWCHQVRDDKGYWNRIEKYISDHSQASFTHSICPTCDKKLASGKAG